MRGPATLYRMQCGHTAFDRGESKHGFDRFKRSNRVSSDINDGAGSERSMRCGRSFRNGWAGPSQRPDDDLQQPEPVGVHCGLGARADVELRENAADVVFHGFFGEVQLGADLFV